MVEWLLDSINELENLEVTDFTFSLDGDIIPDAFDPVIDIDSNLLDDSILDFLDIDQNGIQDIFEINFSLDGDLFSDSIDPLIDIDDPFQDLDDNGFFDAGYAEYFKHLINGMNSSLGELVYE